MLIHPDEVLLTRWLDGEADDEAPRLADHVAQCRTCRHRVAALVAEAAGWRDALALTPAELGVLHAANLAGGLVATVAADRARAGQWAGRWHLLLLFGLSLVIGLTWALVGPLAAPVLTWAGRLLDVPGVTLEAAIRLTSGALASLTHASLLTTLSLASDLLVVAAALLLAGLWVYRLRPVTGRQMA